MKATLALLGAALAMTACTRTIEKPVPIATAPVVVEPHAAAGATSPLSCMRGGQPTSNGGVSCQSGTQYRCNNGTWEQTALSCSQ